VALDLSDDFNGVAIFPEGGTKAMTAGHVSTLKALLLFKTAGGLAMNFHKLLELVSQGPVGGCCCMMIETARLLGLASFVCLVSLYVPIADYAVMVGCIWIHCSLQSPGT
jgi:hypothetical protein